MLSKRHGTFLLLHIIRLTLVFVYIYLFVEQVIAGLDRAAATMKKREHAILTITSEYGFGNAEIKRDLAVVPPNSTLLYEVEMLDFVKVISPVGET